MAEISAAYVCASLGIVPTVRHADYIASWLEVLRSDPRAIVQAAGLASRSADWLLGRLPPEFAPAGVGEQIEEDGPEDETAPLREAA
ncbi:ArdC antirestriction protein [Methylobacterium sp. AMS5]|nr:ArdC antirestriction protein [Methylobacterium sp. AMS5]